MNPSNEENLWARLDDASGDEALSSAQRERVARERNLEDRLAAVLGAEESCPDRVWRELQTKLATHAHPRRTLLQRIDARRLLTNLAAACLVAALSSGVTYYALGRRVAPAPSSAAQAQAFSAPLKPANDYVALQSAFRQERAAYAQEKARFESELAKAQREIEDVHKDRDAAVAAQAETDAQLQALTKDLEVARNETESLRADVTRIAANDQALRGELKELRRITGRLGLDFGGWISESGATKAQRETMLSMAAPSAADSSPAPETSSAAPVAATATPAQSAASSPPGPSEASQ